MLEAILLYACGSSVVLGIGNHPASWWTDRVACRPLRGHQTLCLPCVSDEGQRTPQEAS